MGILQYYNSHFTQERIFVLLFVIIFFLLKHIVHIEKQTFLFIQLRNFWTEFLVLCSQCSSFHHHLKTLFHVKILKENQKSWNWRGPDVDCKEDEATTPN